MARGYSNTTRRILLIERDGSHQCHWCGIQLGYTLDHVKPRSAGGRTHLGNLVLACESCNQARGGIHRGSHRLAGQPSRPKAAA